MNVSNYINRKKISINGQILENADYGLGYTIVWQKHPIKDIDLQNGVFLEEILCRCVEQADFINKTKYADEKYELAKNKLIEVLNILNSK